MGVNWTEDQKAAIEERGRGIVVSAAAGSGKTAVLIERIIRLLCDKKKQDPGGYSSCGNIYKRRSSADA